MKPFTEPFQKRLGWVLCILPLLLGCDPGGQHTFSNIESEELREESGVRDLAVGVNISSAYDLAVSDESGKGTPSEEAISWLNAFRREAGLHPVEYNANIEQAAQGHAFYIAEHRDLYQSGMSFHDEVAGKSGFLAKKYWERQELFESTDKALGEVIAFQRSTEASMAQWMESVYHRIPLLDTRATTAAYALQVRGDHAYGVLELSQSADPEKELNQEWVAYPQNGASLVPTSWDGKESPQPMAPPGGFPSGPVFTLSAADSTSVRVAKSSLTDENGHAIDHTLLDATNDDFFAAQTGIALYANKPLQAGSTYTIEVSGFRGADVFQWKSSFTTTPKTSCNLLGQETCGTGKACYPKGGATSCEWQGVVPEGGECSYQNDCAEGTTCVEGECRRLCDTKNEGWFACGKVCDLGSYSILSGQEGVGVCATPHCTPHMDDCGDGKTCQVGSTMTCGVPGVAEEGESCTSPEACSAGLACTDEGKGGTCRPLCALGEEGNGTTTELPRCRETCGAAIVSLPQHPGLAVCTEL